MMIKLLSIFKVIFFLQIALEDINLFQNSCRGNIKLLNDHL